MPGPFVLPTWDVSPGLMKKKRKEEKKEPCPQINTNYVRTNVIGTQQKVRIVLGSYCM